MIPRFRSPLSLWQPRFGSFKRGAQLDPDKCHAMVSLGTRMPTFSQCQNKHKATRPFNDGKEYPVCGVHANRYDNACKRLDDERDYRAKQKAFEERLRELPIRATVYFPNNSLRISFRQVTVNIEDLEALAKKADQ